MQLNLKNIGKLKEANVELNGITVIAGENDTGKSTLGKILFSIFNSYKDVDIKIQREKADIIGEVIYNSIRGSDLSTERIIFNNASIPEISMSLIKNSDKYLSSEDIKADLCEMLKQYNEDLFNDGNIDESIDRAVNRIKEFLIVSDEQMIERILMNNLFAEFGTQICNIYSEGKSEINLTIKSNSIKITLKNDIIESTNGKIALKTEVIYIDDPFIIDERKHTLPFSTQYEHRKHLCSKLFFSNQLNVLNEIVTNDKLRNILEKLNIVCDGVIENNISGLSYRKPGFGSGLKMRNISTGLKTFIIIKMLLQNGSIEYNGTIVLDEPEVHLHPEWQLIFAELIVLLQKEFDMHILLNTHSPYFLNAIEVYSKKYDISDKCKYYLAENNSEVSVSSIIDVTNETEKIYDKLYRPFQNLENEEYRL